MYYKVAVLNTLQDFFYYTASNCKPRLGDRVWVPFINKQRLGIVIDIVQNCELDFKLKEITKLIDEEPLLSQNELNLIKWVSEYYKAPLPLVLKLAIPKKYRQGKEISVPFEEEYYLNPLYTDTYKSLLARAKKQREIVDFIVSNPKSSKTMLKANNFSNQHLNLLLKKEVLLKRQKLFIDKINAGQLNNPLKLNVEQQFAVSSICKYLNTYRCFLLKGVTGSGKTEVYLQVISQVLQQDKQVLVLVPEIGLTPQLLNRFRSRFNLEILVMHSGLNDTERQYAWQLAKDNKVKLIIGTRSAIFTPMPKLGLIVIDEEHDLSLKQIEGVRYFARDTAIIRAANANIPIILGSATPSLESLYNCRQNKYHLLELSNKALSDTPLHYQILDIRTQKLHNGFAPETIAQIAKHIEVGNQVLIFINRRGFAPVLMCHDCGAISDCINCDTHLNYHRSINKLICHHCGYTISKPINCVSCGGRSIVALGVGTQRVFEYLSTVFPTNSIVRIDKDEISKKNSLEKKLELIDKGEAQIIVGTQMLAKGHHFPKLSLVVILDVDNSFYTQDFRNLERLGQLLIQVAGRAGREKEAGQVIIQTALPNDPLLNILIQEGYDAFVNLLLEGRSKASLPPYAFLAIFRAESNDEKKLLNFMYMLKDELIIDKVKILGPAPAPMFKKNKQYRMQLMLKSNSRKDLHIVLNYIQDFLRTKKIPSGIGFNIDVDPLEIA